MKPFNAMNAVVIVLGLGMTGPAAAMPQAAVAGDSDLVINVQADCHSDVRRHYLPEYDRRVWHRHRQSNCRVVRVDPVDDDDYDYDPPQRDCHREVRRHYLDEYGGNVTHEHVGRSCRVKVYRRYSGDNPRPGGVCVQIGPIRYCEN